MRFVASLSACCMLKRSLSSPRDPRSSRAAERSGRKAAANNSFSPTERERGKEASLSRPLESIDRGRADRLIAWGRQLRASTNVDRLDRLLSNSSIDQPLTRPIDRSIDRLASRQAKPRPTRSIDRSTDPIDRSIDRSVESSCVCAGWDLYIFFSEEEKACSSTSSLDRIARGRRISDAWFVRGREGGGDNKVDGGQHVP